MIDWVDLRRKAEASGDREAYVTIARGVGYRIGAGARARARGDAAFFVEVVLDPFPERPAVSLDRVACESAIAERLQGRGYAIACDDSGVITCERAVPRTGVAKEIRAVQAVLKEVGRADESAPGPGASREPS